MFCYVESDLLKSGWSGFDWLKYLIYNRVLWCLHDQMEGQSKPKKKKTSKLNSYLIIRKLSNK